jgi:hypothetical protein
MTTNSQTDQRKKVKDSIVKFILWFVLVTPIWELLKFNKRLKKCSQIVSFPKGKVDNFNLQRQITIKVVILTVLPFFIAVIHHLTEYSKHKWDFSYSLFLKKIQTGESSEILDYINLNPSVTISLMFVVLVYVVMQVYLWRLISNYEIRKRTNELCELAKRLNIIDESLEEKCLWTNIGILIEIKTSTAPELVKNSTFWNQLDMDPGDILYAKEGKKTFFIMSGFELSDAYDFTIKD